MLISIMHFPMSDEVKIKICCGLAEKDLSISKKLFVVDRNLIVEDYILISIIPFYMSN